jgi:hypothetical protein
MQGDEDPKKRGDAAGELPGRAGDASSLLSPPSALPSPDLGRKMTRLEISQLSDEDRKKRLALRKAARGTPKAYYQKLLLKHARQLRYMQPRFPDVASDEPHWEINAAIGDVVKTLEQLAGEVEALPDEWKPQAKTPPRKPQANPGPEKKVQRGSKVVFLDKWREKYEGILGKEVAGVPLTVMVVSDRTLGLLAKDGSRPVVPIARVRLAREDERGKT